MLMGVNCFAESMPFDMNKCLDTIKLAESSGRDSCIGDNGKSRGAYQIQERTWKQYSRLNWLKYTAIPKDSRLVASMMVSDIVRHVKKFHLEEWESNPYAIVCMHYNCGINTKHSLNWWIKNNKNKAYKTTYES